ncbi:cobalamin-binding protein [Massilia sp. PAMC28688]|uniref:cobalamin-binding protein n=1 Tax=Massilia sp. PAMC28688 TaxID=2861283 RepID=UPI001C636BFC|nr:cobalamin-binding protein [Massilia sp. PAMC28688]QYF94599.1 cobalamin-binding protein [Massilia sp. PAMC28688]
MIKILLAAMTAATALHAGAAITVIDDDGRPVTLQKPAQRVIAMSPHVTELLYAAGGGEKIVAGVDYSDYPEAARRLPRVGSNRLIDMERVIALKPDLIVIWLHGSSERQIEQIRTLGIPMFHSEPKKLEAIADSVARMGKLMGTEPVANAAAAGLRQQLAALQSRFGGRAPVRLFYQVWDKPLYTLSGGHIVSDAIGICGGENIYASLKVTAPIVSIESVLEADPEVIVSTDERSDVGGGVGIWKEFTSLTAVKRDNLFRLDGNLLNRSGPRMIAGAAQLCDRLELARQRRKGK